MHPLVQAVALSFLVALAGGQQPFYSNNGNHHHHHPSPSYHVNQQQQQQQQPNSFTTNSGGSVGGVLNSNNYQANNAYSSSSSSSYNNQPQSYTQLGYAPSVPYSSPPVQTSQYSYGGVPQFRSIGGAPTLPPAPPAGSMQPQRLQPSARDLQPQLTPAMAPSQQTPVLAQYGSDLPQTYSTTALGQQQPQQIYNGPAPSPAPSSFSHRHLNYADFSPSNGAAAPTTMASFHSNAPNNGFGNNNHSPPTTGGLNPHQLLSRRGPFDGMINRAKDWMPGRKKKAGPRRNKNGGVNAGGLGGGAGADYAGGMNEMHRLPKPPKYPLYDMPREGMVTPPPPPLMSPIAQMPSMSQVYSTFSLPPNKPPPPQRGGGKRRPRPPPGKGGNKLPSITAKPIVDNKRRRARPPIPPPLSKNKRQRTRPGGKNNGGSISLTGRNTGFNKNQPASYADGFDHPMASNVAPVNAPPLGRPLSYEEYMKRPTHSFTDDPWNFDPNAKTYNEGMNTHAMKYNYDPLGTNTLDTSVQSHLDINKMSYPGDVMNMETMKEPPKPLHSQLGGWDLPPSTYRDTSWSSYNNQHSITNDNNNQYSSGSGSNQYNNNNDQYNNNNRYTNNNDQYNSNNNNNNQYNNDQYSGGSSHHQQSQGSNRFDQRAQGSSITFESIAPSTTTLRNSFNQYDPTTEASIVKSETLNPLTLLSDGGIEFDIDATLKSPGTYDYKLSDHYSPVGESTLAKQQQAPPPQTGNYDPYSPSGGYHKYPRNNEYGSRRTRANYYRRHNHALPPQPTSTSKFNLVPSSSTPLSTSTAVSSSSTSSNLHEGIGVFQDFIKDPNPGLGKARARHSLFNALLS